VGCLSTPVLICFDAETGQNIDHQTPVDGSTTDDCAICMSSPTRPKTLPCGHTFCADCVNQAFVKCQPKCPTCGYVCGEVTGNQPRGKMTTRVLASSLAGYDRYATIQITYDIPDGIQDVSDLLTNEWPL